MDSLPPHPWLNRPDKCGITQDINGREWICVRTVHDDPPRPSHGQRSEQWGRYAPRSARHVMVRRWPNSDH